MAFGTLQRGKNDYRVAHIKPRSLRHSYAALAVQARFNAKVLQQAMGHSSIRLVMDTYGGLFDDDLNALAESMDSAASQSLFSTNAPPLHFLERTPNIQ